MNNPLSQVEIDFENEIGHQFQEITLMQDILLQES